MTTNGTHATGFRYAVAIVGVVLLFAFGGFVASAPQISGYAPEQVAVMTVIDPVAGPVERPVAQAADQSPVSDNAKRATVLLGVIALLGVVSLAFRHHRS